MNYSAFDDIKDEITNAISLTNRSLKQYNSKNKMKNNAQETQSTNEVKRPPSPDIRVKITKINEKIDIQMKKIQYTKGELESHCAEETEPKHTIEKVVSQRKIEKDLPKITTERNSFKLSATRNTNELNVHTNTSRINPFKLPATPSTKDLNVPKITNTKMEIESADEQNAAQRMIEIKRMQDPSPSGSQFTNQKSEGNISVLSDSSLKKKKRKRGGRRVHYKRIKKEMKLLMSTMKSGTGKQKICMADVFSDSDE